MARPRTPHPDPMVNDLENIRALSWGCPDEFGELTTLLLDPVVVHLARGSASLDVRVRALQRGLGVVANRIERREKAHPPQLNRSDAFAARVLFRLGPDYERMPVGDLQGTVAGSWQKRDKTGGLVRLASDGFRKQHQTQFYERFAIAFRQYSAEVVRKHPDLMAHSASGPGVAVTADVLELWELLRCLVLERRPDEPAIPREISAAAAALDEPLRQLHRQAQRAGDPAEAMTVAMIAYARELHASGRDSALVAFRSNVSLTLHIIGQHDARVELGQLALDAATVLANDLAIAEILVDDLGWGNYMRAERALALQNIDHGRRVAESALGSNPPRADDLTITVAKAVRHRALICADADHGPPDDSLDTALALLNGLTSRDDVVKREIGQIHHARALLVAIRLGISESGAIDSADAGGHNDLRDALESVKRASQAFHELGDQARYTKALFLQVRLLNASGLELEARQVRAVRDRALATSDWSRPERVTTLERI
jgi:hypothetical protein